MRNERETEKLLEQFSPRPAPRELGARIIREARREAKARRVLTPAWRWGFVAGSVLLAFIILADWRISASEQNRLSSLLNQPGVRIASRERAADERAREVLACLPDLDAALVQALRQSLIKDQRVGSRPQKSEAHSAEAINEY